MDKDEVAARLSRVHCCLPIIAVFNERDGIRGLTQLCGSRLVDFSEPMIVAAVLSDMNWDGDRNRSVRFCLNGNYAQEVADMIAPFIERLELGHEHPLRALQTGRVKMREQAVAEITRTFVAPAITEVESFGLTVSISVEVLQPGKITVMKVAVMDGEQELGHFVLDGFSGLLLTSEGDLSEQYASPELVREALMGIVEGVTA